jgi:hypothetical protein
MIFFDFVRSSNTTSFALSKEPWTALIWASSGAENQMCQPEATTDGA